MISFPGSARERADGEAPPRGIQEEEEEAEPPRQCVPRQSLGTRAASRPLQGASTMTPPQTSSTAPTATATTGTLPFISVIVPIRNEAAFIADTLLQLLSQDYPRDRF